MGRAEPAMTARAAAPPVVDTVVSAIDVRAAVEHAIPRQIDGPDVSCAFEAHRCTHLARGAGGFDQHHPWPMDTGGPIDQTKIYLCPNHHRRQHALVRYLVECDQRNVDPSWDVLRRFNSKERPVAVAARDAWRAAGRPTINGWPCLAATA